MEFLFVDVSLFSGQQILGPPRSKKKTPQDIAQDVFDEAKK